MSDDRKGYCDRHMTAYLVINGCLYCTPSASKAEKPPQLDMSMAANTKRTLENNLNRFLLSELYTLHVARPDLSWTNITVNLRSKGVAEIVIDFRDPYSVQRRSLTTHDYQSELRDWIKHLIKTL